MSITSITPYLDEFDADPETRRVLAVALEMTRISLKLTDDHCNWIIAKQLSELAKAGERNPDLLCEGRSRRYQGHHCRCSTRVRLGFHPLNSGSHFTSLSD